MKLNHLDPEFVKWVIADVERSLNKQPDPADAKKKFADVMNVDAVKFGAFVERMMMSWALGYNEHTGLEVKFNFPADADEIVGGFRNHFANDAKP